MLRCPNCGEENPERFRHCGYCGTQLSRPDGAEAADEVRKTVTVVFCDLIGSTSLGEKLDSESLREVLDVYFSAMRQVLERHGGTVEKYIGDAIMAVFGLPRLHEDDALRAVRASRTGRASTPARSSRRAQRPDSAWPPETPLTWPPGSSKRRLTARFSSGTRRSAW